MSSDVDLAGAEVTGPVVVIEETSALAYEFNSDEAADAWAQDGLEAFTRVRSATAEELAAAAVGQEVLLGG